MDATMSDAGDWLLHRCSDIAFYEAVSRSPEIFSLAYRLHDDEVQAVREQIHHEMKD